MQRRSFLTALTGGILLPVLPAMAIGNVGTRSLTEVYAFTCPHCLRLAAQMQVWLALHHSVKHHAVHIVTNPDDLKLAGGAYAAALLGKGAEYRQAFFTALHSENKSADERTMTDVAKAIGLDGDQFTETLRGAAVTELLSRSEAITKAFQITATPTLIIDMQRVRLPDRDPLQILQEEFGA